MRVMCAVHHGVWLCGALLRMVQALLEIKKDGSTQYFHHSVFLHVTDSLGTQSPLSVAWCLFDIHLDHMHILFLAHIATECVSVHISVSILHLFHIFCLFIYLFFKLVGTQVEVCRLCV